MEKKKSIKKRVSPGFFKFPYFEQKNGRGKKGCPEVPKRGYYEDQMKVKNLNIKKIMTVGK